MVNEMICRRAEECHNKTCGHHGPHIHNSECDDDYCHGFRTVEGIARYIRTTCWVYGMKA